MNHKLLRTMIIILLPFLFSTAAIQAEDKTDDAEKEKSLDAGKLPQPFNDPTQAETMPGVKYVEPGVFSLGEIIIRTKQNTVEFPAVVNMDKGLLEYIIVGDPGKTHESLLRTDIQPFSLQVALLLLGLEGTSEPLSEQGDPRTPQGDKIRMYVKWEKEGKEMKCPVERLIKNKNSGKEMGDTKFVFTGSKVEKGIFVAQLEQSIAALFHDPLAMIDNPHPDGVSDEVWFVNEETTPAVGTPMTVVIEKADVK